MLNITNKRAHNKLKLCYSVTDFYADYKVIRKKWRTLLSKKDYIKVVKRFLRLLSKAIIRERYQFKFFHRMGYLRIAKRVRTRRSSIDWGVYNKTGVYSKHLNTHSRRSHFYFYWEKRFPKCFFTNQTFYKFIPVSDKEKREVGKRGLSAWVQECATNPKLKDYDCLIR